MLRSRIAIALWALPSLPLAGLGCVDGKAMVAPADATAVDAAVFIDAGTNSDASTPLGVVDFAISGCATGDGSEASPCLGPSPLVLQFTVLAPAEVENQVWSFGDGSEPDTSLGPIHRFAAPGSYDIGLNVDGPGGSAGRTRLAAVVVIPAPLGSVCESDSQCASADCACAVDEDCPAPLAQGICLLSCASHAACGANLCIDLSTEANEPWQRPTCLPACDPMAPVCGPNASCQALPGIDGELGSACFPTGILAPIGSSCRDADGLLDDSICASGLCADVGIRGMCSAPCADELCATDSICVTPTSGSPDPMCVPSCENFACDGDGQLSCRSSGDDFTVDGPEIEAGYCTPSFP